MSEHNIFQEIDDAIEQQRLQALWERYGSALMVAAALLILATAVITYWRSYHENHQQAITGALVALESNSEKDPQKQIAAYENYAESNHGRTQQTLAELYAGEIAANANDKDKAVKFYDAVSKDANADFALRQFAGLRSVELQMDTGDANVLMQRLDPLTVNDTPFRFSAMEDQAYLALKLGNKDKARTLFTQLSQNAAVPPTMAQRATDMMRYVSE